MRGGDTNEPFNVRYDGIGLFKERRVMQMKKRKILGALVVLTLVLAMLLGSAQLAPAEDKIVDIKIVSAAVGSGTYVNITAMSAMIKTNSKWLRATPIPTPGWIDSCRMAGEGRADIAGTGSIDINAMMKGIRHFKGKQYTGLKWLWPFMFPRTSVVTLKDSPFRGFRDLKNARVAVSLPGSAGETDARAIFDALGFEPKKIIHMAYTDMASALKDKTVDVVIQTYSIGAPLMVDLTTVNDSYFIPMDDDTWNKLEALGLGYVRLPIPAKSYRLQDTEVSCQAKGGYMVATDRLSDKIVYEVARCFWDDFDKTITLNQKVLGECRDTVKTTLNIPGPCPMHPGAMKYFKEKGMLK